jgi:hypothetical protein
MGYRQKLETLKKRDTLSREWIHPVSAQVIDEILSILVNG